MAAQTAPKKPQKQVEEAPQEAPKKAQWSDLTPPQRKIVMAIFEIDERHDPLPSGFDKYLKIGQKVRTNLSNKSFMDQSPLIAACVAYMLNEQ